MIYAECENCGSIWSPGTEEWEFQKCSACGWRPGDPIEDDNECAEDDDPNDSRNL